MRIWAALFGVIWVWSGCQSSNYSNTTNHWEYRVLQFTDDELQVENHHVVHLILSSATDSLGIFLSPTEAPIDVKEWLLGKHLNDYLHLRIPEEQKWEEVKALGNDLHIRVVGIFPPDKFAILHPFLRQEELVMERELMQLLPLLKNHVSDKVMYEGGVFIIKELVTNNARIKRGEDIALSFELMEPVKALPKSMRFNFGKPDQVVVGMERGLSQLKHGEQAIFVIPSHLAFGEKGANNGQILPHQPVMFRVKVYAHP